MDYSNRAYGNNDELMESLSTSIVYFLTKVILCLVKHVSVPTAHMHFPKTKCKKSQIVLFSPEYHLLSSSGKAEKNIEYAISLKSSPVQQGCDSFEV